jgi:hypothetical protein
MASLTEADVRKIIREELKRIESERVKEEEKEEEEEHQQDIKEAKRLACKKCGGLKVTSKTMAYLKVNSGFPSCKC